MWEPFERNNQVDFSQPDWAYQIGQADFRDVEAADGIFAVINGVPPDEGVMVELGMAIALGKPTFLFRDDLRTATDSGMYPLNLMLFTGCPKGVGKTTTTPGSRNSPRRTRRWRSGRGTHDTGTLQAPYTPKFGGLFSVGNCGLKMHVHTCKGSLRCISGGG